MSRAEEVLKKQKQYREALKSHKLKHEHLLIQYGLENYSKTLKDGEPCPLCGSEQHPSPFNSTDLAKQVEQIKKQIEKAEAEDQRYMEALQAIEKHSASTQPVFVTNCQYQGQT